MLATLARSPFSPLVGLDSVLSATIQTLAPPHAPAGGAKQKPRMTDFSLSLARSSENGGGVGLSPAFDSYACTSPLLSFKSLLITLFLALALSAPPFNRNRLPVRLCVCTECLTVH